MSMLSVTVPGHFGEWIQGWLLDAPDRLLWASGRAKGVRVPPASPEAGIIGLLWGEPERIDPGDEAFPEIADLTEVWAHSGPARVLIFASGNASTTAEVTLREAGLTHVLWLRTGGEG